MNFLLRSAQPVVPELPTIPEARSHKDVTQKTATTLEGLISEDSYQLSASGEDADNDSENVRDTAPAVVPTSENQVPVGNHTDVTEDEGWITIPYKELPDNWNDVSDILQLRSVDRSFIFPGEQIHIAVCLSASKKDTEIITPFRVAAVMSKNGKSGQNGKKLENLPTKSDSISEEGDRESAEQNAESNGQMDPEKDFSATESLLRMEDHKQQTEDILERFRNSNFFVRIAESDELLWSKRKPAESSPTTLGTGGGRSQLNDGGCEKASSNYFHNAIVDKGSFDGNTSGGVARDSVRCYSLCNGDIVVLLRVNIGVGNVKDPVLEVLQFEKLLASHSVSENLNNELGQIHDDPCRDLLSWLLPLDRTLPPPRPLSPPLSSTISHKPSYSASGSQIFSFSNFRSYSMPSLPQSAGPPSTVSHFSSSKPAFDLEDFNQFSPEKLTKNPDSGNEVPLSFRGVPLEPERYSVHCGLEGIYLPGKRWRRKVEILQPIEIHSFAAGCTTEDLLCVQIKNVSPAHVADIIMFVDAITIVFEEASKGGALLSLPIATIEAGQGHSLPNLALRRGEEHSFILKPAGVMYRDNRSDDASANIHLISGVNEHKRVSSVADQYAVLVSCRCNYTESKLFFKQATNWQPCVARDLMVSVASEPYKRTVGPNTRVPQLPVQVLTLEATNLTSEDLTLTVLAPESYTSSPSVLYLNSAPTNPINSYDRHSTVIRRLSPIPTDSRKEGDSGENKLSNSSSCTHLWLQSAVPLGCVPARSSSTVKLELLPLTDGIITLDSLQIAIKEKGITYIPEQSLKIYAASIISTGIL